MEIYHVGGSAKMKGIDKLAKVVTKVLEVTHWVAEALMLAAAISIVAAPQWLGYFVGLDTMGQEVELSAYGFEIMAPVVNGMVDTKTFVLFAIGAVIIFSLVAMIFRNLYLIIKKSEGTTPFQKDNVRMMREIGIFSIGIPVIGLIMNIIARLVLGPEAAEMSNSMEGFVMGIIVLCLTQFFAHGVELEKDVDGLL
jgi:hypothetical protein